MRVQTCVRFAAVMCALAALPAFSATAEAPPYRVAVLRLRDAVAATKEGQKRLADLAASLAKRQEAVSDSQAEIVALKNRLADESALLNGDAKQELSRNIELKSKQLEREIDDLRWESQTRQTRIYADIGSRMRGVIADYAKKNSFALVLDASNPVSSITWASAVVNITGRIVQQYDRAFPVEAAPSAPAAAKPQASPNK